MGSDAKYDAFISYSHAADGRLAPALHRALERFAKPWYRLRAARVFMDATGLEVNEALWPRIQEAIGQSRFFVLLASPQAAASRWVQREIAEGRQHACPVLIVLTEGEIAWNEAAKDFDWQRTNALPGGLSGHFSSEPLYADLRWARDRDDLSPRHPRFQDAVASLAAAIHGVDKDQLSSKAVQEHRKTVASAWTAVTALVVLLFAAIYQSIEATRARNLAERRLQDAVGVANHIVFTVDRGLQDVAGAARVRQDLLTSGGALLDKLRGEEDDSPAVLRARLVTHHERGDLAITNDDLEAARREFERARELAERLVQRDPANATYWQDLLHARQRAALALRLQGDHGAARRLLDAGLDSAQHLIAQKPHQSTYRADLALLHSSYCDLERAVGNVAAAEAQCRKALDIEEALARDYPDRLENRTAPGHTLNRLGDLFLEAGRPRDALPYYRKSMELRERLLSANPDKSTVRQQVAASHARLGQVSLRLGRLDEARREFEQALAIVAELIRAEPADSGFAAMQANMYDWLGQVAAAAGDVAAARSRFADAVKLATALSERDPSSLGPVGERLSALLHLGDLEYEQARLAAAGEHYAAAVTLGAGLQARKRVNGTLLRLIALAHDKAGNLDLLRGELAAADGHFRAYLDLNRALLERAPASVQLKVDRAQALRKLADLALETGDLAAARTQSETALQLARETAAPDSDVQVKLNLWSQLLGLCKVLLEAGPLAEAAKPCREAVALTGQYAADPPKDPALARMHYRGVTLLALVALLASDYREADALLGDSTRAGRQRLAREPGDAAAAAWVAEALARQGDARQMREDYAGALKHFQESLALTRRHLAAAPAEARLIEALWVDLDSIAACLVELKQGGPATQYASQALQLAERRRGEEPQNRSHAINVARSLARLARAHAVDKRWQSAEEHARRAIELIQPPPGQEPAGPADRVELTLRTADLAAVLEAKGELREAQALLDKAVEIHSPLTKREPVSLFRIREQVGLTDDSLRIAARLHDPEAVARQRERSGALLAALRARGALSKDPLRARLEQKLALGTGAASPGPR